MRNPLDHLRIRGKFVALFLALGAAFAVVAATSFAGLQEVKVGGAIYGRLQAHQGATVRLALVKADLNECQILLQSMAVERDRDALRRLEKRRAAVAAEIDGAFARSETGLEESVALSVAITAKTWKDFEAAAVELATAALAGEHARAAALCEGPQARRYKRFANQVRAAIDALGLEVQDLEVRAERSVRRTAAATGGACLLIFLATIGVATVLARSITSPLALVSSAAADVAAGKLARRTITVPSGDELGELASAFAQMRASLAGLVGSAKEAGGRFASAAGQLSVANRNVASAATDQARKLNDAAGEMSCVSTAFREVTEAARRVKESAEESARATEAGTAAVATATESLSVIRASSDESARRAEALGEASERIGAIVATMRGLSEATNLLAFNATLEAAHAGDFGRGFAVIAADVRQLAEHSATSAAEIGRVVARTRQDIDHARQAADRTLRAAEGGVESASRFSETLGLIRDRAGTTNAGVAEISRLVLDQSGAIERTNLLVSGVATLAQETLRATEEVVALGRSLEDAITRLESAFSRFQLDGAGTPTSPAPGGPGVRGESARVRSA